MKKNILEKIDEALVSDSTSIETKILLKEVKADLKLANTEMRIAQVIAILIKIITSLFDD